MLLYGVLMQLASSIIPILRATQPIGSHARAVQHGAVKENVKLTLMRQLHRENKQKARLTQHSPGGGAPLLPAPVAAAVIPVAMPRNALHRTPAGAELLGDHAWRGRGPWGP